MTKEQEEAIKYFEDKIKNVKPEYTETLVDGKLFRSEIIPIKMRFDKEDAEKMKIILNILKEKDWNNKIDRLEHISSQTMEENQKLIKWIMTILDTVETMEVREREQIKIPVYIEKTYKPYDANYLGIYERERITIPEITIVRMHRR